MNDSEAREKATKIVYTMNEAAWWHSGSRSYEVINNKAWDDVQQKIRPFILSMPSAIEGLIDD